MMVDATSSRVCSITLRSSAGVEETGMEPVFSIRVRYSGVATIAAMRPLSRSMMGYGVPAAAQMPSQP
jgi:hypothetical protein